MPKTAHAGRRAVAALTVALFALIGHTTATAVLQSAAQHRLGTTSIVAGMPCSSCTGGL